MNKQDYYSSFADEWAQRMRDGKNIIHDYIAKPALYSKIGDVQGKDVLCVGCGSGEECEYIASLGANRVVGIDLSPALIKIAKESFPEIEFYTMDMEELAFVRESFDLVISSLTIHYVGDWSKTLQETKRVLKDSGRVIITTNHPIRFGSEIKRAYIQESFTLGYVRFREYTKPSLVFGDYLNERRIEDKWFNRSFKVEYYHRPLSAIFKDFKDSGLTLIDFIEPKPEEWVKEVNENFYNIHSKIPFLMLFELQK